MLDKYRSITFQNDILIIQINSLCLPPMIPHSIWGLILSLYPALPGIKVSIQFIIEIGTLESEKKCYYQLHLRNRSTYPCPGQIRIHSYLNSKVLWVLAPWSLLSPSASSTAFSDTLYRPFHSFLTGLGLYLPQSPYTFRPLPETLWHRILTWITSFLAQISFILAQIPFRSWHKYHFIREAFCVYPFKQALLLPSTPAFFFHST